MISQESDIADQIAEEDPSDVITYTARGGQTIILSRQALESYGEAFIDQMAISSGKKALVLVDENVLDQAKEDYPDSKTPIIDKYADYLLDFGDIPADQISDPLNQKFFEKEKFEELKQNINEALEGQIEDCVEGNSPAAITQPNGDRGLIILPSPSSLEGDEYKDRIVEGLSEIDRDNLGDIPGSSMDWAKISVYHEAAHLLLNHTNVNLADLNSLLNSGLGGNQKGQTDFSKFKLKGEVEADIKATKDFNKVSGTIPPVAQSFANLRLIKSFVSDGDMADLGANASELNQHNTGGSVISHLEKEASTHFDADKIQFTTAYTNTQIRGLIGAVEGKEYIGEKGAAYIGLEMGNPLRRGMNSVLNESGIDSSLKGDDPLRLVKLGNKIAKDEPQKLYASTKVLLESGHFDDQPEIKENAQRFVRAIEKEAPGLVDTSLVEKYRTAMQDPVNQNFMQQLERYYNPENGIGYLVLPKSQPAVTAPTVAAPVL